MEKGGGRKRGVGGITESEGDRRERDKGRRKGEERERGCEGVL
jgi:hypothetical protein